MMSVRRSRLPFAGALLPLLSVLLPLQLAGCHVDTHKNGNDSNVDIGTPFGSLQVKTNQNDAVAQTGLKPFPGAVPVPKQGDDNGSADVNLSFGSFKLGVHAAELQTSAPEDAVLSFYRKDMAKYGTVITCRGSEPVGQPSRTPDGLTCDDSGGGHVHVDESDELQLRAGSQTRQHIVGLRAKDGGTHIGLVALDLPANFDRHHTAQQE